MKLSELMKKDKEILVTMLIDMDDERKMLINMIKDLERRLKHKNNFGDRSSNENIRKLRKKNKQEKK